MSSQLFIRSHHMYTSEAVSEGRGASVRRRGFDRVCDHPRPRICVCARPVHENMKSVKKSLLMVGVAFYGLPFPTPPTRVTTCLSIVGMCAQEHYNTTNLGLFCGGVGRSRNFTISIAGGWALG
jgi:hypothetical protein